MSSSVVVLPAALKAKGYTYQSSLYQTALNGGAVNNPVFCAACHLDNALNAAGPSTGVAGTNSLTQDMHTLHSSELYSNGFHEQRRIVAYSKSNQRHNSGNADGFG